MAQEIYHRSEWGNPNEQWGNIYLNADLTNELYKRASEYENSWVTDQLLNKAGTKPSIILTPTAYEDGVLNSVKPAKTFGSELVTNGSFDTDSDWTKTQATISNGEATITSPDGSYASIYQDNVATIGKTYKCSINVVSISGTMQLRLGSGTDQDITTIGTKIFYIKAFSSTLEIKRKSGAGALDVTIDNVSVKEVTEADFQFSRNSSATRINELGLVQDVQLLSGELIQNGNFEQIGSEEIVNGSFDTDTDWTKGLGWSIGDGVATCDGTNQQKIFQNIGLTTNKNYKFTIEIKTLTSGSIKLLYYTGSYQTIASNLGIGTHTIEFNTSGSVNGFIYIESTNFIGSIDNVSVKEVGQNWTFGTGWSISNGVATQSGGNATLQQSGILTTNKLYKLVFEITEITNGSVRCYFGGNYSAYRSSVGTYTEYVTSGGTTTFFIQGNTLFSGSIDNISVIEITDDTDLPRINYTNFDYEDVLGDELVTNGTFDSDSGWTKGTGWSIANGRASYDGTGGTSFIRQNDVIEVGKTYKVTLEVLANEGSGINTIFLGGTVLNSSHLSVGSYTFYGSTNNTAVTLTIYGRSGEVFEIDNVSVKEITYDVVVPYSGEGSLLLEPQSTNLIINSEDFEGANWTDFNVTLTSGQSSPDGNNNAYLVEPTNSSYILFAISVVNPSTEYTFSYFFKEGTKDAVKIAFYNDTASAFITTDATQSFIDYGNGWKRIIANVTTPSGCTSLFSYIDRSSVVGTFYAWGAQLEQGSYPTSYIPTNGSTVTRLADVCNNSGSSDLINSTEGVLYVEISALADDGTKRYISLSDGSNSNDVRLYFDTGGYISALTKVGGSTQAFLQTNAYTQTDFNKIAFKYKENNFSLYVNGIEVATDNLGSVNTTNTLNQLAFFGNLLPFYGNVKCLAVFKEALSDTELQKLTTI